MAGLDPITAVANIGNTIIDKIFPDKTKAAETRLKLLELQQSGGLKELETVMSVMLAEAKSNDPWTSRARPSFLYVMYIMILWSVPMGVLSIFKPDMAIQIAAGMKAWLAAIPESMWWTFGVGYTGYTVSRSVDKSKIDKIKKMLPWG